MLVHVCRLPVHLFFEGFLSLGLLSTILDPLCFESLIEFVLKSEFWRISLCSLIRFNEHGSTLLLLSHDILFPVIKFSTTVPFVIYYRVGKYRILFTHSRVGEEIKETEFKYITNFWMILRDLVSWRLLFLSPSKTAVRFIKTVNKGYTYICLTVRGNTCLPFNKYFPLLLTSRLLSMVTSLN